MVFVYFDRLVDWAYMLERAFIAASVSVLMWDDGSEFKKKKDYL